MRRVTLGMVAALSIAAAPAHADVPVTLRGSPESMVRQNEIAKGHGLAFTQTPAEIRELEQTGDLVRLEGNADYELADFVRYSQARPEMRMFIERLSAQYHAATGEKLVVTSLTRPSSRQPGNSHALSVHPTGAAVDLRVSQRAQSRQWLENTLLSLEEQGLLDITREKSPPHYHVALFPDAYVAHVERLQVREAEQRVALREVMEDGVAPIGNALLAADGSSDRDSETSTGGAVVVVLLLGAALALHRRRTASKLE